MWFSSVKIFEHGGFIHGLKTPQLYGESGHQIRGTHVERCVERCVTAAVLF
jgi:hypothetical protein